MQQVLSFRLDMRSSSLAVEQITMLALVIPLKRGNYVTYNYSSLPISTWHDCQSDQLHIYFCPCTLHCGLIQNMGLLLYFF